ncbi:MAG: DoxX family protein [Candidatus Calescibacterium sp.]
MEKVKNILFLIGRIILGLYYISAGLNHFIQLKQMAQLTASKGVPLPELGVIVSGILLLIGGITILTGFLPYLGVLSLVIFFLPVTFIMHNFWAEQDAQMRMMHMIHFLKNMGLMSSVLMFLAIPEPWPYSLGKKK